MANDKPLTVLRTEHGPNTGDTVLVDHTGGRWLVVHHFTGDRGTGDRRGVTDYRRIWQR